MSCISYPSEEKHCNSQAEEASLSYVLNSDLKDKNDTSSLIFCLKHQLISDASKRKISA